jgi:hypothetical protein
MNQHEPRIEPPEVVQLVESYAEKELADARKYENSTPLDESGIWSLHRLAAAIYALGYEAGERTEAARNQGARYRHREGDE